MSQNTLFSFVFSSSYGFGSRESEIKSDIFVQVSYLEPTEHLSDNAHDKKN